MYKYVYMYIYTERVVCTQRKRWVYVKRKNRLFRVEDVTNGRRLDREMNRCGERDREREREREREKERESERERRREGGGEKEGGNERDR